VTDSSGNTYAVGFDTGHFIRKFSLEGDELWTTAFAERPSALFVDADENVFFTVAVPASFGKLDRDGQPVLHAAFGRPEDWAGLIAADQMGNIFVTSANLEDPRPSWDAVLYRFDAEGHELDRWTIASDDRDLITELAVASSGAAILAGDTDGALPGQTSFGGTDVFVARIQP
jgi:hypothetical protein